MRVLIVIPTQGKRTEMLAEAIESVENQTSGACQLIVTCGDGSLAERLNVAIESSDCEAFAVLCDDDKLDSEFIGRTTAAMTRELVDIVYTDCHIFGDRNCPGGALGKWSAENLERNTVPLVTSLCTKRAWKNAGGFRDVKFFDWDFWKRCYHSGATAYWLKEPLFWYRDHKGQASKSI